MAILRLSASSGSSVGRRRRGTRAIESAVAQSPRFPAELAREINAASNVESRETASANSDSARTELPNQNWLIPAMYGLYASNGGGSTAVFQSAAKRGSSTEARDESTRERVASTPSVGRWSEVASGPTLRSTFVVPASMIEAMNRRLSPER